MDLKTRALSFEHNGQRYDLLAFNPEKMTLKCQVTDKNGQSKTIDDFPFAHLPKKLKQVLNPL